MGQPWNRQDLSPSHYSLLDLSLNARSNVTVSSLTLIQFTADEESKYSGNIKLTLMYWRKYIYYSSKKLMNMMNVFKLCFYFILNFDIFDNIFMNVAMTFCWNNVSSANALAWHDQHVSTRTTLREAGLTWSYCCAV